MAPASFDEINPAVRDRFMVLVVVINAGLEHILAYAAFRAYPVSRKICKCGSGSDAVLGISFFRIIGVSTGITKIFLHDSISFQILIEILI